MSAAHVSPLLDELLVGKEFTKKLGVTCYPAKHKNNDQRYIVKEISIPESQVQVQALLLSGAVSGEDAANAYFENVAKNVCAQAELLEKLSQYRYFLPFAGHQCQPKEDGVGFQVYLLSEAGISLTRWMKHHPMTHADVVNLGIDMCAALAVSRDLGYIYADLNPNNIFITEAGRYSIGDLGFLPLENLNYAALPAGYLNDWTAPEVRDILSTPNTTMDTYALGMLLYQILNGGDLPFDPNGARPAELAPPAYADFRLGRLVLKAIEADPKDRYADPMEMGRMLLTYAQRVKVDNTPVVPASAQEETPEEAPEALPIEEEITEEPAVVEEEPAPEPPVEEAPIEEAPVEEPEPEPEEPPVPYVEEKKTFVLEFSPEVEENTAPPEDDPILPDIDEAELLQSVNPASEELPDDLPFDIPDSVFDQEPEIFEYPLSTAVFEESGAESEGIPDSEELPQETEAPKVTELEPQPPKPKDHRILKAAAWVFALLILVVLSAGAAGGYYYYQNIYIQSVEALELSGAEDALTVEVITEADSSLLSVVCLGSDGSRQEADVVNGTASFTELAPSTSFELEVHIRGRHELIGQQNATYETPGRAEISDFAAITGSVGGSALLTFRAEGTIPAQWRMRCYAPDEAEREITFTGNQVTLNSLTFGKEYTCVLQGDGDVYLTGTPELSFVASDLILAKNLLVTAFSDGVLSATWDGPKDAGIVEWLLELNDSQGGEITRSTTQHEITFEDLDPTLEYTLTVTAYGMSKSVSTTVSPDNPALTAMNFTVDNGTNLLVSWVYTGNAPENWQLIYTLNGGEETDMATESDSVRIAPAIPGGHYSFYMRTGDDKLVLNSSYSFDMPEAKPFSGYSVKAADISAQIFPRPEKDGWGANDLRKQEEQLSYEPSSNACLLLYIQPKYGVSNDPVNTVIILRDADGNPVSVRTETRSWSSMWNNHYGTVELPELPADPGLYTACVYFNGGLVLEKQFEIL